jgi:hypothetical protein
LIINIYSLIIIRKNRHISPCDRDLVIGMIISSLSVIIISAPSVVIQCLLCHRLSSSLICKIEGFNSFCNGCTAMYMLVALSIVRYLSTTNSPLSKRFRQQIEQRGSYLVLICFIMGSVWAIPPIFGRVSGYVPEGLGFHCGLNWFDRSLASRFYFALLFLGVYFIPMIIIVYINIHIQRTVYRLTHIHSTVLLEMNILINPESIRRHVSNKLYDQESRHLHRLYEDRRFVVATRMSMVIYLIAWTPYSVTALAQLFGDYYYYIYNPWMMTTCSLLAKLSMIINPVIYMIILKGREIIDPIPDEKL